jgi:hypothetical protein
MFESKTDPIVIPQYEHSRLAGLLAALWGNDAFARPAIDFDAFVKGVTLHDWGYGNLDNLPIGGMSEAEWLQVMRKGIAHRFDHPVTDIVAKLHIRRLLSSRTSAARAKLIEKIDAHVSARLAESGFPIEAFQWADRITQFCDSVAFAFSFGESTAAGVSVWAQPNASAPVRLGYEIRPGGEIWVTPWPFGVLRYQGFGMGYRREGYPEILEPELVPFRVLPG